MFFIHPVEEPLFTFAYGYIADRGRYQPLYDTTDVIQHQEEAAA